MEQDEKKENAKPHSKDNENIKQEKLDRIKDNLQYTDSDQTIKLLFNKLLTRNTTKLLKNEVQNNQINNDLEIIRLKTDISLLKTLQALNGQVLPRDWTWSYKEKINNMRTELYKECPYEVKIHNNIQYKTWLTETIQQKILSLGSAVNTRVIELKQLQSQMPSPIVWGIPKIINNEDGNLDDFAYYGKTFEKPVYIPFRAIHEQLAKANCLMSSSTSEGNYMLAHLVFVISNKVKNISIVNKRYVDFPIVFNESHNFPSNIQIFNDNNLFQQYMKNTKDKIGVGKYYRLDNYKYHSENPLESFLRAPINIKNITSCLAKKLDHFYGNHNSIKVCAINLFINSTKNVCNEERGTTNCETILFNLMNEKNKDSFLTILTQEVNKQNFYFLEKPPYMFISVAANDRYDWGCTPSLKQNANIALESEVPAEAICRNLSIDIKQIAGKIILSTAEKWFLHKNKNEMKVYCTEKIKSNSIKIPFYSGFVSKCGSLDPLKINNNNFSYALPKCFDEYNIITIGDVNPSEDNESI